MKKLNSLLIAGLFLLGVNVFAQDVSIDKDGNVTTGSSNPTGSGNLDVTGSSGEHAIRGVTSGTGAAGVYGENNDPNSFGGYFKGDTHVTGNLSVEGTINNTGLNSDTVDGKHSADLLDKATYDTNGDGIVNSADTASSATSALTATSASNSDTVDNKHASDLLDKATYDADVNNIVDSAEDADTVDAMHASDIIAAAADEVRTPISACGITINSSGSYYVISNISATQIHQDCITVAVDNVTIDLMGFTLIGLNSTGYGVFMNGISNVEVRNGGITNFATGFMSTSNSGANSNRIIDLRVVGNGSGLYVIATGSLVRNCTVSGNNLVGISAGNGSSIVGNTVYGNVEDGIKADSASMVKGNVVYGNGQIGINASEAGSTVEGNTVYANGDRGIHTWDGSTVVKNTVYNNQSWGIYTGQNSIIMENTISVNNLSDTADIGGLYVFYNTLLKVNIVSGNNQNNIYVAASYNSLEENVVSGSTNGINFISGGNFYKDNRAMGNTTNYAGAVPSGSGDGGGNVSF